jgi:hypothetical protein
VLWGNPQNLEVLVHGGLQPAAAMERAGELEGGSDALGREVDHASPNVDGFLKPSFPKK